MTLSIFARAQQPFITDDADVTERGAIHLEISNELDKLQHSALPALRQNTLNFKFAYGAIKNIELGFDNQLIAIYGQPPGERQVFGYGDFDLSVKWQFNKEKEGSKLPSFAGTFSVEFPTGDARRSLGSGLTDYALNGILQKTFKKNTVVHLNSGMTLAGNTATGELGVQTRGTVFTGGASVVHTFSPKLDLGAEVYGAVTANDGLGIGQVTTQIGGNYQLKKNLSFDFGLLGGGLQGSPKIGVQIGFSVDFERRVQLPKVTLPSRSHTQH